MSSDALWVVIGVIILAEATRYAVTGRASVFREPTTRPAPVAVRVVVLLFALVAVGRIAYNVFGA
ncbi:MAG TPA: hypothetical protein VNT60_11185 [Deinococcales bacterium]|nr:hypothetical protein [Deinococcales bacterium]HWG86030.1 hypothetical protein [Deinococcales bacterium]